MRGKPLRTIKVRLSEEDLAILYRQCGHDESLSDYIRRLIMEGLY